MSKEKPTKKSTNNITGKISSIAFIVFLIIAIVGLLMATPFLLENKLNNYLICLSAIILIILLGFLTLSESEKVKHFTQNIEKRASACTLLSTLVFGSLITALLASQGNQIAQKQVDIANRETAPALSLTTSEGDSGKSYTLRNEKGTASYVSLYVLERYSFKYGNNLYEINLGLPSNTRNHEINLDDYNKQIIFLLECKSFDRDAAFQMLKAYLQEKIGSNVAVSNTREIVLTFFDYKNQNMTFNYTEYNENINLIRTNPRVGIPKYNATMYLFSETNPKSTLESLVDEVIAQTV